MLINMEGIMKTVENVKEYINRAYQTSSETAQAAWPKVIEGYNKADEKLGNLYESGVRCFQESPGTATTITFTALTALNLIIGKVIGSRRLLNAAATTALVFATYFIALNTARSQAHTS